MHHKYCVIDDSIAFHGSYNWTVNARNNNSESVIKTTHKETVEDLTKEFDTLFEENKEQKGILRSLFGNLRDKKKKNVENTANGPNESVQEVKKQFIDIDEEFLSIITAEAKRTDVDVIKQKGYELCADVHGDHNNLDKAMDSLYHLYVADNAESIELKEHLVDKLVKKKEELIQSRELERTRLFSNDDILELSKQKEQELEKASLEKKVELAEKEIQILDDKIEGKKEKIESNNDLINGLSLDFVKPAFNWWFFIPVMSFVLGLGVYLLFFYSSSLYIMIYSLPDAMGEIRSGIPLDEINPQVFDSEALIKAFNKPGLAGYFVMLFFFVPLVIAYVSHSKDPAKENMTILDYLKMIGAYLVVFVIDAFIAAKVTNTIVEVKKSAKQLPPDFELSLADYLSHLDFWLVFCLGALPFVFLSILINKLSVFFKNRSPETEESKLKLQKKNLEKSNKNISMIIDELVNEKNTKDCERLELTNEIKRVDKELVFLPVEMNKKKELTHKNIDDEILLIKKKADLYTNDIDNDNINISSTTLKHRVSAFTEGWVKWLNEEYAVDKAIIKTQQANNQIDSWLTIRNDEKRNLSA